MKKAKEEQVEIQPAKLEDQKDLIDFLSHINSTINEIRQSEQKKYSLLSSIFNCFYENQKLSLPKKTIYDYIHEDILKYKNRMIISFVENGTNSMETISENNYVKKTHSIITRNKCLVQSIDNQNIDRISIDVIFTRTHKNLIFKNLFGKLGKFNFHSRLKFKNLKKPKKIPSSISKSKNILIKNNNDKIKNENINEDDYEIEILESEQEETDITELKKGNKINVPNSKSIYSKNSNNINTNINGATLKMPNFVYLNKKRKGQNKISIKKDIIEEKDDIYNDIINNNLDNNFEEKSDSLMKDGYDEEDNKEKKEEVIAEKEILSLIEEGKIFLSLFKDKEVLKGFESNNKNMEESDNFIKNILLDYQNGDILKSYLNVINDDYGEFQNNLKSLIGYKTSLNDSGDNKFLTKFSIMNKIILGKEKCNILIDKIVVKLKQLILEYNFIKKVLNNIDANKVYMFQRFKEVITKSNKQDKENYINELKLQLHQELTKSLNAHIDEAES